MIEILKIWRYHQRVVFLTQIGDKYQLFYKSTGLAGHGSKGMVLPHLLLKDSSVSSPDGIGDDMLYGWIPKAYKENGKLVEYYQKVRGVFPKAMWPIMDLLEKLDEKMLDVEDCDEPKEINAYCREYIKTAEDYYDWIV